MQPGEMAFLVLAVSAISLFGGVLAWASWMEWRAGKARQRQPRSTQSGQQDVTTTASVRRAF